MLINFVCQSCCKNLNLEQYVSTPNTTTINYTLEEGQRAQLPEYSDKKSTKMRILDQSIYRLMIITHLKISDNICVFDKF